MGDDIKSATATSKTRSNNIDTDSEEICLKDETIYRLVDHTVGAIALECGYHVAHQGSLDILTDVCCDYLRRIATLLRVSRETEHLRDSDSDFVDSLERVFHHLNVPSVANLHQFLKKLETIKRYKQKLTTSTTMTSTTNSSSDQQQHFQQTIAQQPLADQQQQHETHVYHHHHHQQHDQNK